MSRTTLLQPSKEPLDPRETILLLGNYRPTLTLARELTRQGHSVLSGLYGCDAGAEHSRFVKKIWDHPDFDKDQKTFFQELGHFVNENGISIIFPVSEDFVRLFVENPNAQPANVAIAMVDPVLVEKCLDKTMMLKLASKNNVPTAPFGFANCKQQIARVTEKIGFPLVIRPQDSTKRLNGKKALFIASAQDLHQQLPIWPTEQRGLILQQKAGGRRHNIYFAASNGKLFRYLHAIIERTDNPDGSGLAVEGITIAPMPELQKYTAQLSKALNYTGIGCAQFLVDDETGKISFLEINARIAGNHAVPEHAGLNLSNQLIDLARGRKLDTSYIEGRPGIRYVWTRGDIEAAKIAWVNSEVGNIVAIKWVMQAVWAAIRADLHMTFSWRDPKPGLVAITSLVPNWRRFFSYVWQRNLRRQRTEITHSTKEVI